MANAIIWAWLVCVGIFFPASQALAQSDPATSTEKRLLDLPELVARVKPSVVTILTYDGGGKPIGQGSGFLIAKNRIVTNHHVIAGAHHAEIRLASGATIRIAGLVADDVWHDVAMLQVDLSADLSRMTMSPLELAKTKPRQGERIAVIGSPLGLEGTVSEGMVSTLRELSGFGTIIGITAAISPGSSGSPVFNMRGEVIAVATFVMFEGQSINFAVGSGYVSSLKVGKMRRLSDAGPHEGDRWGEAWSEFTLGIAAYLADEHQKAIDHFRRVVEIDSDNELVWRSIGVCELELAHFALAIVALNQAIRLKPDLPEAHANLGLAYGRLMQWQEAIAAYKESVSLKPDFAEAHNNLGVVYESLERYQEALGSYKQAIRIKPDYAEAHSNLGIVYERLDRYPEAIAAYQQAIRIDPRIAKAHFNLGLAYRRLTRYEDAVAAYKQAISIESDYAEAHNNLGAAFGESGRYHEALAAYKQAVSIMPDFASAHLGLGLAHMALGNRTSAIEEYKILQRLDIDVANQLLNVIWP